MAFLKFNKSELVNLSYSLKRELISANKTGAYSSTTIVGCNTRRYHGLLAVTLDRFGGDRYMMLSALDESLIVNGKQFNLGIHRYRGVVDPRGHKYVIDFSADPVPELTYKVGQVVFRKSLLLAPDKDQVMVKYELLESPAPVTVVLRPFLGFRNVHALTHQNPQADPTPTAVPCGVSFRLYDAFPDLFLQLSDSKAEWRQAPCWYENITYSDEYRRGFECMEDLLTPGTFVFKISKGSSVVFSASMREMKPTMLKREFNACQSKMSDVSNTRDQLVRCADSLITAHNGRKKISAGLSWMYTGLLRETLMALPGLALYGLESASDFEEILDNLIDDNEERFYRRTTQVEAPLYLACTLQAYIDWGADPGKVWNKYGQVMKDVIESYLPGRRKEVTMHPNGLLWAQMDGVALSWMNAYIDGRAVTERAGYQIETNAFWFNAISFAINMEKEYGRKSGAFVTKWTPIRNLVRSSFHPTFWNERRGCFADYVDGYGQNMDIRPNQLYAIWVKNSPVDEEFAPRVLRVVDSELMTARGIRTLSPRDPRYKGVYDGSQVERDLAYHQGSTRPFLLEPYVEICFRVFGPSFWKKAEWLVEGFYNDLAKHGVGAFAELYDGDPPHESHGAISSALSTAALLSVDRMITRNKEDQI